MQKVKYNKEKHNYAYQYRYSNRMNRKNNYHQGNTDIFNPQWSNKIYFRGPDGWFHKLKDQCISHNWTQRNESYRDIPNIDMSHTQMLEIRM
jgi:hypothetical protein